MQTRYNKTEPIKTSGFGFGSFKSPSLSLKSLKTSNKNNNLTNIQQQKNNSLLFNITNEKENQIWEDLSIPVEDAVVYVDTAILQIVKNNFVNGIDSLYENGSINVKNIMDYTDTENDIYIRYSDSKKIVFILSSYLMDYETTIKNILLSRAYQECHIYTAISETSHNLKIQRNSSQEHSLDLSSIAFQYLQGSDDGYFLKFQKKLKQWIIMGNEIQQTGLSNTHIIQSVSYQPFLYSLFSSNLFLIPTSIDLFPYLKPELYKNKDHIEGGIQLNLLPEDEQEKIYRISSILSSIMDELNVKDDLFTLGDTSHLVAREIMAHTASSARRKSDKTLSLIIMDRTLDLGTPSRHLDNIMDKLYNTLSRSNENSFELDIQSDIVIEHKRELDFLTPITCSFSHGMNENTIQLINSLISSRNKEGLILIRKKILEILKKEIPNFQAPKILGKLTQEQLVSYMNIIKKNEISVIKNSSTIECILAILESNKNMENSKWEELLGTEKSLALTFSQINDYSVIVQQLFEILKNIINNIKHQKQHRLDNSQNISVEDILNLILFVYATLGTSIIDIIDENSEVLLKNVLFEAIIEINRNSNHNQNKNKNVNKQEQEKIINQIFKQLRDVSMARKKLNTYQDLLDNTGISSQPINSLIKTLMIDILNGENDSPMSFNSNSSNSINLSPPNSGKPNQGDLNYIPYGQSITHFFSGIGRRHLKVNRPKPIQNQTIMLFVLGGITFSEVNEINSLAKQYGVEIIIGSTDIATNHSISRNVFKDIDFSNI